MWDKIKLNNAPLERYQGFQGLGVRSTRLGLAVYYQTHLLPTAGSHGESVLQGVRASNNKVVLIIM